MSRGTLYSMEPGWIDEVSMTSGGGVHQVQARCFASFEKTTRRRVTVQLDGATLNFLDSFCGCVAGFNTFSHACGVLQYVAFLARYMRAVDGQKAEDRGDDSATPLDVQHTLGTSFPCQWVIPSQKRRSIEPTVPLDRLNLSSKPKMLERFQPLKSGSDD